MKLISKREQLIANIETVENDLTEVSDTEQAVMRDLIKTGRCFVAYEVDGEHRFAPSRFLGYVNNNIKKHSKAKENHEVDGRESNPVITKVLETKLESSNILEKRYLQYCKHLGEKPANHKNRRYWSINIKQDFIENMQLLGEFPEGKIVERIHKGRERNTKVVNIAKENFKRIHGKLFCQVCKFDFEKHYGVVGRNFIEGHHTIPVSNMREGDVTRPEDIALLCSNCHRMTHKHRPWLIMDKLPLLLKRKSK